MYFQKDYILRMIEMLGKLAEEIRERHNETDALQKLDELALRTCGLQLSMLQNMSPEQLQDIMGDAQQYFAAELLFIELEVKKRTMTDDILLPRRIQILALYAALQEIDYLLPACEHAAQLTDGYLDVLPLDILMNLSTFFERGGQYDHAEDMLYAALAQSNEIMPQIESFYARLTLVDDRALLQGGLPRDEIEEGQQSLRACLQSLDEDVSNR